MNSRLNQSGSRWWAVSAGALMVIGSLLWFVPYHSVELRACPISGSSLEITRWFGVPWEKKQTTTRLEQWLRVHEPGFEPRFRTFAERAEFGNGAGFVSCGKDPAAHLLAGQIDSFVDEGDDARIAGLVLVIRFGTRDEQVDAILDLWKPSIKEP